jgi:hypothetical protein
MRSIWKVQFSLEMLEAVTPQEAYQRTIHASTGQDYRSVICQPLLNVLMPPRDFAANCGIPFKTPEEYFLQEDARPFVRQFDPSALLAKGAVKAAGMFCSVAHTDSCAQIDIDVFQDATVPFSKTNELDIVLFCGSPGAGKSSYYWRSLQPLGYARINQDILKTVCLIQMIKAHVLCNIPRSLE